jgi:antitoxin component YwqK of YwqJK toxin-antitoxin module
MLKHAIFFSLFTAMLLACACKVNQFKNGKRTGLWISKDNNGEVGFKSRGRYKKDKEIGSWKFFYNDTLYQKDRYSGNIGRVKFYHSNKRISARGTTEMEYNGKLLHWYYNGDWKYFDVQGNLVKIVTYKKGNAIAEIFPVKQPAPKKLSN